MIEMIANGVAISLAAYIVLLKLGIRRLLSNSIPIMGINLSVEAAIDAAFTGLLLILFSGTYGGTMSAIIGGLVLSFLLFITRLKTYQIVTILITLTVIIGAIINEYY